MTLKELLTGFVEKGLYGSPEPEKKPIRSPLPTPLTSARGTIPSLTNAEIDKIFLEEDMERRGMKRDR